MQGEAGAFREVLAEEAAGVLAGAALPGRAEAQKYTGTPVRTVKPACLAISFPWSQVTDLRRNSGGRSLIFTMPLIWPFATWARPRGTRRARSVRRAGLSSVRSSPRARHRPPHLVRRLGTLRRARPHAPDGQSRGPGDHRRAAGQLHAVQQADADRVPRRVHESHRVRASSPTTLRRSIPRSRLPQAPPGSRSMTIPRPPTGTPPPRGPASDVKAQSSADAVRARPCVTRSLAPNARTHSGRRRSGIAPRTASALVSDVRLG